MTKKLPKKNKQLTSLFERAGQCYTLKYAGNKLSDQI